MAWIKRNVTDQNVEFPNRFKIDGESKIIEPDFGTIVDPGTPINRQYLQPIEDYLEIVETKDGAQAKVDTLAGEGNTKTVKQLDDEVKTHKAESAIHKTSDVIRTETETKLKVEVVSSSVSETPDAGRIIFDTSQGKFFGGNGTEWV